MDTTLSPLSMRIFEVRGECEAPPVNPLTGRPRTNLFNDVVPRSPKGYHRHHVCGNRDCLNPDHVVVVSASFHRKLHRRTVER